MIDDKISRYTSSSVQRSQQKFFEEGTFMSVQKMMFMLRFDTIPVWLLALDLNIIATLVFMDFDNLDSLLQKIKLLPCRLLFEKILSWFNQHNLILFNKQQNFENKPHVYLISGSVQFFMSTFQHSITKYLYITEQHTRVRKIPNIGHQLHRASLIQFGGPLKYEVLWGSSECGWAPTLSCLRRTIGDYIHHNLRPTMLKEPPKFVTHHDTLHPYGLQSWIQYPTFFSSSGTGFKQLQSGELLEIFGIPSIFHITLQPEAFIFTPVQILDKLLQAFLQRFFNSNPFKRIPAFPRSLPEPVPDGEAVFVPQLNRYLPQDWCSVENIEEKAAKADDASVPLHLWNKRISCFWDVSDIQLDVIRSFLLRCHFRRMFRNFLLYLRDTFKDKFVAFIRHRSESYYLRFKERLGGFGGFLPLKAPSTSTPYVECMAMRKQIMSAQQVFDNYFNSTYFEWNKGSSLIFWNWSNELQYVAQAGFTPFISGPMPNHRKRASTFKSPMHEKILSKVVKALKRSYLVPVHSQSLNSLIDYFAVDKAGSDIRVVFNGTSCGLNDAVWAPNFWLPTADSMSRSIGFNYKFVDLDLGEMFLNFPLHQSLQNYSGVDITPFRKELLEQLPEIKWPEKNKNFAKWTRDWMGFAPSPEWSCRYYYFAEEFIRGFEKAHDNPLRWDEVVLNLPGDPTYNPALPFVFKWNKLVQRIAGDLKAYVDDLRAIGWSKEHAWKIARLAASRLQFLGIQDAGRKRRIDNGPWAGSIFISNETQIQRTVAVSKWNKGKNYILDLAKILKSNPQAQLEFKHLERVRGFLCHLAMTYEIIFPFLKGFHLTLCSHLPKRNDEGWKLRDLEYIGFLMQKLEDNKISEAEFDRLMNLEFNNDGAPKLVTPVKRFHSCLNALEKFFSLDEPPKVTERTANVQMAVYGFVDASKSGFGASIDYENGMRYRIGIWGKDQEDESSNYREFANLVETLESEAESNRLNDVHLIIATDNSTVEASIYKGNSTNEKLFDLIVRLRFLELKVGGKFIVTHVSGKRMISQGTDGISRGHLREGVSIGQSMLSFCPWHKSALDRYQELQSWILKIFGQETEILKPCDWFGRGHDHKGGYFDRRGFWRLKIQAGTYVWHPPPAAAATALEELRKARLKRRKSTHVVIIPKLLTPTWLKQLNKAADFVVFIKPTHPFWPPSMFEPLVMGICFPYLPHSPWQTRRTPKLLSVARSMSGVQQETDLDPGDILCELLSLIKRLPFMPPSVVRKLLFFQ